MDSADREKLLTRIEGYDRHRILLLAHRLDYLQPERRATEELRTSIRARLKEDR